MSMQRMVMGAGCEEADEVEAESATAVFSEFDEALLLIGNEAPLCGPAPSEVDVSRVAGDESAYEGEGARAEALPPRVAGAAW